MATSEATPGWYWSRYWSAERLVSCFEGPAADYEDSVTAHWDSFFRQLQPACKIVDIGTGNGAVPAIANRVNRALDKRFSIVGVDQADIDPHRYLAGRSGLVAGVTFIGGTPASCLPFDDASIGALTSQFALEYMPLPAVIPELGRVAANGARLQFVVHAREGVAASGALTELGHCDFVSDELQLFDSARQVMDFVTGLERRPTAIASEEDARAMALIEDFENRLHRLDDRRRAFGAHLMLDNVRQTLVHLYQGRKSYSPHQLQQHVGTLEEEVLAHAARLRDLLAASRDVAGMQSICARLESSGFKDLAFDALVRDGQEKQLGWLLRGVKP